MIKPTILVVPTIARTISFVPMVTVSRIYPFYKSQYPFPLVNCLIDVRGLHPLYADQVYLSDTHSTQTKKGLIDQLGFADVPFYSFSFGKLDAVGFGDSFNRRCIFYRDLSDRVSVSDIKALLLEKTVSDVVHVSEHFSAKVIKKLTDGAVFDDIQLAKSISAHYVEVVGVSDAHSVLLDKSLVDGISVGDTFSSNTSKRVSDGVVFSDVQFTKSTAQSIIETIGFSDKFFLNGNTYCDASYFAEDYIGVARST